MTKTTVEITLDSDKSRAAEEARDTLDSLEARLPRIREAALKGSMNASTLADVNDEIALAKLRAEVAEEEATAEREGLAANEEIATAVAEFLTDESLSSSSLMDAAEKLRQALAEFELVKDARNASVVGWVKKLHTLGIPDSGLTIGDDEVRIYSAYPSTSITIGSSRVEMLATVAPYVAHLAYKYTDRAKMRIDPDTLTRVDTRSTGAANIVTVRLLNPIGNLKVGDILTSRNRPRGALAQMVHAGNAELIEGTIPEPSTHERTLFVGDTSLLPDAQHVTTLRNVHDDAKVEAAVAKAFEN